MPSRLFSEQAMGQVFGMGGNRKSGPTYEAQQLAYDAMEAAESGDVEEALARAKEALDLDPDCVDALTLLSQAASESQSELIDNMRRTVKAGERALGKEFFEENTGYFWGILETRPYMRARSFLAQCLAEAGRRDEAVEHYEAMLALNPGDNQGLRYCLMGLYLEAGHLEGAAALFEQFDDEFSAMFAWGRVLERFMVDDEAGAMAALDEARQANPHVEPLLTGKKRMPRQMPGYYGIGDENEAVICVDAIGTAWKRAGGALAWLKKQA
jgi:tetratricopeptide (TPR) repeat protein